MQNYCKLGKKQNKLRFIWFLCLLHLLKGQRFRIVLREQIENLSQVIVTLLGVRHLVDAELAPGGSADMVALTLFIHAILN